MKDGDWFNPNAPHGTEGGYVNYLCRCRECKTAWAEYVAAAKARRRARRVEIDGRLVSPGITHGGASAHRNHGCECEPCMIAHRRATT